MIFFVTMTSNVVFDVLQIGAFVECLMSGTFDVDCDILICKGYLTFFPDI